MTLQELCLSIIINKFDRYYMLFCASKDAKIKRQFEFLQRKYSFEIASRLHDRNEISEKYIDLVVNKHLKVIDTDWFQDCSFKKICSKFEEIGSNVVKIQFHDSSMKELCFLNIPWEDVICLLPNVEVISFEGICYDRILESIANYCFNIIEIDLRGTRVTNNGIKSLCSKRGGKVSCSKLKRLFIGTTNVSDNSVEHLLKNLPSLEVFDCLDLPWALYEMHKDDWSALDKVEPYKLTYLNLLRIGRDPSVYKHVKICLSVCPNLKVLSCSINWYRDHTEIFSHLSHLEELYLGNEFNCDINNLLKSIGGQLTLLTLESFIVSVSVLAKHCPRLKQLNLKKIIFIVDDDDDSKLLFPCLGSCTFEVYPTNDSKTDKAVKLLLSSSPNLESISLKRFHVLSPEIKTQILKCCENGSIKSITLSNSKVEMPFIRDIIMNCLSLKSLILDGCHFEAEEEELLRRLAQGRPNHPKMFLNRYYKYY